VGGCGGKFHQFAIGFVLQQFVDVVVAVVIPDVLVAEVHGEGVAGGGVMLTRMGRVVATAADVAADEAVMSWSAGHTTKASS